MKVSVHNSYLEEKRYIINLIFQDYFGLEYELVPSAGKGIEISHGGKTLKVSDHFFAQFNEEETKWLSSDTLPQVPLAKLLSEDIPLLADLKLGTIPVIFGTDQLQVADDEINLGLDVFGSAFFMLSRYEESVVKVRDEHERFPAKESLASKEGFILRPIINEYLEILWLCIAKLWPGERRKPRTAQTLLSCDVDYLWDRGSTHPYHFLRKLSRVLLKEKSPKEGLKAINSFIQVACLGRQDKDPFVTFDYSMKVSERNGLRQAFYFIAGHSAGLVDGYYDVDSERSRKLLREIHKRDHEIGLHLSYNTFRCLETAKAEKSNLESVLKDEGIQQSVSGGRQHFLRWDPELTASIWDGLDMSYDSTLSYAETAGFRSGICYEYPLYDLKARKALQVKERPLVAMECTFLFPYYMGLTPESAWNIMTQMKDSCKKYNGDFTLLWHNTLLSEPFHKELFENMLAY